MENNSNPANAGGGQGSGGGGNNRRRRYRGNRSGNGPGQGQNQAQGQNNRPQGQQQANRGPNPNQGPRPTQTNAPRGNNSENRNKDFRRSAPSDQQNRSRRGNNGRVLTTNQVLVKYDNLLEQHLITRRKYYEYFNRVDDRQLYKLEKNFFDSIEHLRRFESNLEPWQREALEKRKTERYRLDLTYTNNRGIPTEGQLEITPEEIEDPHFTDDQKEAFEAYKDDMEESEGSYEDYLKMKGL